MELEKAKEYLRKFNDLIFSWSLKEKCELNKAIETVLQALDYYKREYEVLQLQLHLLREETNNKINNSLSKEKIESKINKYKRLSDEFYIKFLECDKTDISVHDAGISCDAKVDVLKELLEE